MSQTEAFAWTLLFEMPLVLAWGWHWRVAPWRASLAGLSASALTHPIAWHLALTVEPGTYAQAWYAIEAAVWGVETLVLKHLMGLSWRRAAGLSLAANGCSALLGRYAL